MGKFQAAGMKFLGLDIKIFCALDLSEYQGKDRKAGDGIGGHAWARRKERQRKKGKRGERAEFIGFALGTIAAVSL